LNQAKQLEQQKEDLQQQKQRLQEIMVDKIKTDVKLVNSLIKDKPEEALALAIAVKDESEKAFSQSPEIVESVQSSQCHLLTSVIY
jgi:hypothetical protein